ncbi:MAG: TatD family hydrolase [Hyphomicrobiales bacterium]
MPSALIVDSHCHLDFPQFADELDAVVTRAHDAGVGLMVTISTRVHEFDRILAIAERFDSIYCSVGTHPHNAAQEPDVTVDHLVKIARHPKVVGIGEAGLDYFYDNSPRDQQAASFRVHIAAARETGLPLIIHSRDAEDDTAAILEDEMGKGAFKPLLHCFSSAASLAERGVAIGAYLSFSGILTFNKAQELRDIAGAVPADRLLVETDAPYLAPAPNRGKQNEPSFVVHTLRKLAEVRGMTEPDMARRTSDNFFTLFDKVPRPPAFGHAADAA